MTSVAPRDPHCVFCKIVGVEIPADVVYEDDSVLVFLDVGPLADGHLLLIPKAHYSRLSEVPVALMAQLASVVPMLGRALMAVTGASAYNVLCNEGKEAGQVVPHVHVHLIPRKSGDSLGYRWNAGKYDAGRSTQLAGEYQRALTRH